MFSLKVLSWKRYIKIAVITVALFYLADVCNGIHFACNTIFVLIAILVCIFLLALIIL